VDRTGHRQCSHRCSEIQQILPPIGIWYVLRPIDGRSEAIALGVDQMYGSVPITDSYGKVQMMVSGDAVTPSKRRLAVFLDGTWSAVENNTNIWRIKSLSGRETNEQLVYYEIGVNGLLGGATGKGLDRTITDAYEWLIDQYVAEDEVFIFGFSRGAYAARSLAGLIAKCGLLKAGAPLGVKQLYNRYRHADAPTIWTLIENPSLVVSTEERWLRKYFQAIHVKMVGVWDTVGALGLPFGNMPGISRTSFTWLHTGLRVPIENAYHALAVDEHRRDFEPTLWTVHKPKDPCAPVAAPRNLSRVEQRWFIGAHDNVGGGCANDLLAQIPLRWMMKKAGRLGLTFKSDVEVETDAAVGAILDSYREMLHGCYRLIRPGHLYRVIGAEPQEREDGTHSTVNETIDGSVFARWRMDNTYRQPNLTEWAARKGVGDIGELRNSVRGDDPKEAVTD
jgi:uncharacterized protein (DUF2235 family)